MARRTSGAIAHLIDHDYAAAITLGMGALTAIAWSGFDGESYQRAMTWWPSSLSTGVLRSWRDFVGTGLMTIFFFGIGLELVRERHHGSLRQSRHALAPILAAMGGMIGPALIVLVIGRASNVTSLTHAWGVPMATDIAFSLAILSLAGSTAVAGLRPFLLTLAITDDVLSVAILAGTGVGPVSVWALLTTAALASLAALTSHRLTSTSARVALVAILWLSLARAGVEPPLAGILGALVVPFDAHRSIRLERAVTRLAVVLVLPLFALSFCGVDWTGVSSRTSLVIIGVIVLARLVGKSAGISTGVALARRLGAHVPRSATGLALLGASVLCAIGLTVPLLFAGRLFRPSGPTYAALDLGLIAASVLAAALGVVLLRSSNHRSPKEAG